MHKCGLCRHAVSVCLSRSWTLSQRINISSKKFCHRIVTPFWFFCTKHYGNIPTVTSPNGVVNAGGVGRNHDSQDLLVYIDRQTKFATACGMLTCSRVSDKMTYIYATVLVGRLLWLWCRWRPWPHWKFFYDRWRTHESCCNSCEYNRSWLSRVLSQQL